MRQGRDVIARRGETVFDAAGRFPGEIVHTPLTLWTLPAGVHAGEHRSDHGGRTSP